MSISELEELAGITEEDKEICPYSGSEGCDDCKLGFDVDGCEELYEIWLIGITTNGVISCL